jgi:redox-sensitive bicupin YhaK (pirin superfamily)
MLGCQLWVNLPAADKMTEPAYRDIQSSDVSEVVEENARVRVLSGRYSGKIGAVKGEYVPVQYLDVALQADSIWEYNQTPNDHTLFLYLIEGTLAADENLESFEQKACAMLLSSSANSGESESVRVKAGPQGARFFCWQPNRCASQSPGGTDCDDSQEELNQLSRTCARNFHPAHAAESLLARLCYRE